MVAVRIRSGRVRESRSRPAELTAGPLRAKGTFSGSLVKCDRCYRDYQEVRNANVRNDKLQTERDFLFFAHEFVDSRASKF